MWWNCSQISPDAWHLPTPFIWNFMSRVLLGETNDGRTSQELPSSLLSHYPLSLCTLSHQYQSTPNIFPLSKFLSFFPPPGRPLAFYRCFDWWKERKAHESSPDLKYVKQIDGWWQHAHTFSLRVEEVLSVCFVLCQNEFTHSFNLFPPYR